MLRKGDRVLLPADEEVPEQRGEVLYTNLRKDLCLVRVDLADRLPDDCDGLAEVQISSLVRQD